MIGLKRGFLLIFIIVSDPQVRLWIISIVITDRIDRVFTKCSANTEWQSTGLCMFVLFPNISHTGFLFSTGCPEVNFELWAAIEGAVSLNRGGSLIKTRGQFHWTEGQFHWTEGTVSLNRGDSLIKPSVFRAFCSSNFDPKVNESLVTMLFP